MDTTTLAKKTFCPEDEHARWPKHKELTEGDRLTLALKIDPEDLSIHPSLKKLLTLPELHAHIQKLTYKGSKILGYFIAEKQIRYMIPFATMMHMLLGCLVAIGKPKIGTPKSGIGRRIVKYIILGFIAFISACLYIVLLLFAYTAIETETLLITWMPNIIFFILCLCMIFYRLALKRST